MTPPLSGNNHGCLTRLSYGLSHRATACSGGPLPAAGTSCDCVAPVQFLIVWLYACHPYRLTVCQYFLQIASDWMGTVGQYIYIGGWNEDFWITATGFSWLELFPGYWDWRFEGISSGMVWWLSQSGGYRHRTQISKDVHVFWHVTGTVFNNY